MSMKQLSICSCYVHLFLSMILLSKSNFQIDFLEVFKKIRIDILGQLAWKYCTSIFDSYLSVFDRHYIDTCIHELAFI